MNSLIQVDRVDIGDNDSHYVDVDDMDIEYGDEQYSSDVVIIKMKRKIWKKRLC